MGRKFSEGDEVYYVSGNKATDMMVIASVQCGTISAGYCDEYYQIDSQIYSQDSVFSTEWEAQKALLVAMSRKIACLRDKVREFEDYALKVAERSGHQFAVVRDHVRDRDQSEIDTPWSAGIREQIERGGYQRPYDTIEGK